MHFPMIQHILPSESDELLTAIFSSISLLIWVFSVRTGFLKHVFFCLIVW